VVEMLDYAFVSKKKFPCKKKSKREILLKLVRKNETFVCLTNLAKCYYATASFALWMPNAHDIFAFAINLLGTN
jgi:hypothetical protein